MTDYEKLLEDYSEAKDVIDKLRQRGVKPKAIENVLNWYL